jgi:hypothetical protein
MMKQEDLKALAKTTLGTEDTPEVCRPTSIFADK